MYETKSIHDGWLTCNFINPHNLCSAWSSLPNVVFVYCDILKSSTQQLPRTIVLATTRVAIKCAKLELTWPHDLTSNLSPLVRYPIDKKKLRSSPCITNTVKCLRSLKYVLLHSTRSQTIRKAEQKYGHCLFTQACVRIRINRAAGLSKETMRQCWQIGI